MAESLVNQAPTRGPALRVGVVMGNPKPASRTFQAARYVAEQLTGVSPDPAVDLSELGAMSPTRALYVLDGSYDDPAAFEAWLTASRPRIAAALRLASAA